MKILFRELLNRQFKFAIFHNPDVTKTYTMSLNIFVLFDSYSLISIKIRIHLHARIKIRSNSRC